MDEKNLDARRKPMQHLEDVELPTPGRPAFLIDEHLVFLDDLRGSGITNMFGAAPFLVNEFGLSKTEARLVLTFWMTTFAARHPEEA